ncbi:MAG: CU044_5270 family protein [Actinophytocola sp.]|uniref:CU044_5270 family protein n=1 Tax=Actinophytocola sp. TaxID=1872138 RepID=UPI003D6B3CA7
MPDNVHEIWSDDQLDAALATLRSDVDTEVRSLHGAREELLAAAGAAERVSPEPAPRPRRRWAIVAAAAAAVVVVASVVVAVLARSGEPAINEPAEPGDPVDRIHATDVPLRPGQFRYVNERQWFSTTFDSKYEWKSEYRYQVWVPAQERQVWMERRETTGRSVLLSGSEKQAHAEGMVPPGRTVETFRAACGDYFADDRRRCEFIPSLRHANEEFMASLPRDPDELLAMVREITAGAEKFTPDSLDFQILTGFLDERTVPADLRMACYRALAKIRTIEITENVPNLDGATGTSFAVRDQWVRREIIVDPGTGQIIGEREVAVGGRDDGIKRGTVLVDSSLEWAVVDRMGARPAG